MLGVLFLQDAEALTGVRRLLGLRVFWLGWALRAWLGGRARGGR